MNRKLPKPQVTTHNDKYKHYTSATYPDVELVPEKPTLPGWFLCYLEQRHRALMTDIHEVRRLMGKPRLKEPRVR